MSAPAVAVRGLAFSWPDGREVFSGVDLTLGDGDSLGLIGGNGVGKTTLLQVVAALLVPTAGTVEIFGQRFAAGSDRELRRRVGIVFQETEDQLFSPTVAEDVAFGPMNFGLQGAALERAVRDALDQVGLHGFDERVPHHLSSGERRRVALATVLSYRPDVLLLDEPTSDLDPAGQLGLVRLLRSTSQARIVASHDLEFVLRTCDRVALLAGGRVVAAGRTLEIVTDPELLETHGLVCPLGWADLGVDGMEKLLAAE